MNFYSVNELKTESNEVLDSLTTGSDAVIMKNGKPAALMISISESNFDEMIVALRQARGIVALDRMRKQAAEQGYMTDEEIEEEIRAARKGE